MWLIFALLAAIFNSASNLFKKIGIDSANEIILAWCVKIISIPIAFALLFSSSGENNLNTSFWISVITAGIITSITTIFIFRALKYTDLSYVAPFYTFLPVFLIFSSYFILGEIPTIMGMVGVFLVVFGAYYLNSHKHQSILDPFRYLLKNRGAKFVLLATLLWAITTNLDKIGTRGVSSQFYVAILMIIMSVSLSIPAIAYHRDSIIPTIKAHYKIIFLIAAASVLNLVFQTLSIQEQFVSYSLAIKRLDVLFVVLAAGFFLKEKHILRRFEGAIPMVIGSILILLA